MESFSHVNNRVSSYNLNRRGFLKLGIFAGMVGVFPFSAFADHYSLGKTEKNLSFYNTHTGESLKTTYWANGQYISEALSDVNFILRDHRTDEMKPINNTLLNLLHVIKMKIGTQQPFHIISGYRSLFTNILLRKNSNRVAENSLHMYGKAIDVRLPGCKLHKLRQIAMNLKGGGVGYYPSSDFIHIDVGRVRFW